MQPDWFDRVIPGLDPDVVIVFNFRIHPHAHSCRAHLRMACVLQIIARYGPTEPNDRIVARAAAYRFISL
jgi:hypothetical protein